jgi:hypothetical protein
MIDAIIVACYVLSRLWLWEQDAFRIEFWHALLFGQSSKTVCYACSDDSCLVRAGKDPLDATSAHTSTSRRSIRHRHHRSDPSCMKPRSERRSASPPSSSIASGCPAARASLPPSLMGCRRAIATRLQEQRHGFHACGNNNNSSSSTSRASLVRTSSTRSIEQPFFPSFKLEAERET